MELQAWIEGLNRILTVCGESEIAVYSDSEYVGLGAMDRGRNRNKNADLWHELDDAVDRHRYVEFVHVKGHSQDQFNDRVDEMAKAARKKLEETLPE